MLDAELLAEVYLQLIGGQEPSMMFDEKKSASSSVFVAEKIDRKFREARQFSLSEEEIQKHKDFLESKLKGALWYAETKPAE